MRNLESIKFKITCLDANNKSHFTILDAVEIINDTLKLKLWLNEIAFPNNVQWHEFSGLVDKNGLDIFEDDIIREDPKNEFSDPTEYICSFNTNRAQFGFKNMSFGPDAFTTNFPVTEISNHFIVITK
jgi:hypothetical protein